MLEGRLCTAKTRRFPQKGFVLTRNWPAVSISSTLADQNSWKGEAGIFWNARPENRMVRATETGELIHPGNKWLHQTLIQFRKLKFSTFVIVHDTSQRKKKKNSRKQGGQVADLGYVGDKIGWRWNWERLWKRRRKTKCFSQWTARVGCVGGSFWSVRIVSMTVGRNLLLEETLQIETSFFPL